MDDAFGCVVREPFADRGLCHGFGKKKRIGRAGTGHGRDSVQQILRQLDRVTDGAEDNRGVRCDQNTFFGIVNRKR